MNSKHYGSSVSPHLILAKFLSILSVTCTDDKDRVHVGSVNECCDAVAMLVERFKGDKAALVGEIRRSLAAAQALIDQRFPEGAS